MAFTLAPSTPGPAAVAAAEPTRYLLPPEAYRDPDWYAREQRELFGRTWNLVAYEHDAPAPGDYLPVRAGTDPVLVVRGHLGTWNGMVFVNPDIENHADVLHLWYLHDESLGLYDHTGFVHDHVGPHWVSEDRLRPDAERDRGLS